MSETIHAGAVFINYKLQKEYNKKQLSLQKDLVHSQDEYNKKQLFWSRVLAIATIALVLITLLLVKFG